MNWISLHNHSQYSILESTCSVKGLVQKAVAFEMPALAITDQGNLYGAVDFFKTCTTSNIKPILGAELYVAPKSRFDKNKEKKRRVAYRIILLCKNNQGYQNLCKLSSLGFMEGFYYFPRIDKELLAQYHEGLICLSNHLAGPLAFFTTPEEIEEELKWYRELFKEDFYLELQSHIMEPSTVNSFPEEWLKQAYQEFILEQNKHNQFILERSQQFNIATVATNDVHYLNPDDWVAHEVLINVQSGEPIQILKQGSYVSNPKRKIFHSRTFFFRSPQEMSSLFLNNPEAIQNSLEIAKKCNVSLDFQTKHYPIYIPDSLKNTSYTEEQRYEASSQFLKDLCEQNLPTKYSPQHLEAIQQKFPNEKPLNIIKQRLELELSVIISKGMTDYLLIVWDIIYWAKSHDIPVGPGRGSGAGSVILFLLGITEIEPIRFDLFFERFINPERISYPDIDIDICMEGREQVINYAIERYGKDNIAQIITFGTMKAKMAVKDVGRTLDIPLAKVNTIAKYIPDLTVSLTKALESSPDLLNIYQNDPEVSQIINLAIKLEGSIRNTGIHAAGVIICGAPIINYIPICIAKDTSMIATQYSMKPVESVGMLKVDFLGLKTLTSIRLAFRAIEEKYNIKLTMATLPLNDPNTFKLLHQGKTQGIFQMESKGMQELSKNLQPDVFEEIIAICALYRPGPMDMIPSFINRKHGKESIDYDHPFIESILKETYGIMVYQEQVMQIAGALANYSLGEGDVLRRAMGKKDLDQMTKERSRFCERACTNGISRELAETIFDKMEKFASYGFNKSHATAYGLITYTTLYLKANYTKEWFAALLTCDRDDIEKVGKHILEARHMHIQILPPDINESKQNFVATQQGIRFAMSGIKGVGESIVESIITEREHHGLYQDVYDVLKRSDLKKVTKKSLELLVDAGCFDSLNPNRDLVKSFIEQSYETVVKEKKDTASGVMTFFSLDTMQTNTTPISIEQFNNKDIIERSKQELLKKEKELLGIYLTEHPLDTIQHLLPRLSCVPFKDFENLPHGSIIRNCFIIDKLTVKLSSKNQSKFAILQISDREDSLELPIWSDMYQKYYNLLEEDQILYAIFSVDKRDNMKIHCKWLSELSNLTENLINQCDTEFEKIKIQTQRMIQMQSYPKTMAKKDTPKNTKINELVIKVSLSQLKLSHLCKLKSIILCYPGSKKLSIQFINNDISVAKLKPDDSFFINEDSQALEKELLSSGIPLEIFSN